MTKRSPFRYFKTSPKIIRLAVVMYVRFPLSLRNVEDLLLERGIDINYETVWICHAFVPLPVLNGGDADCRSRCCIQI
ncbi:MAG: putative transposase [bacterium]|jgi:putative transposase